MPFPIEEKYIIETEEKLGASFPDSFRNWMMEDNGGEIFTDEDEWIIKPFLDKSDRKRIARTCNDIIKETESAKEWAGFPENGIAIANNGCGDYMIYL